MIRQWLQSEVRSQKSMILPHEIDTGTLPRTQRDKICCVRACVFVFCLSPFSEISSAKYTHKGGVAGQGEVPLNEKSLIVHDQI